MIINRDKEKATISTNVTAIAASIAINAEMFSIIIDGIYTDKILAGVREPLFNAVDSHTEAGRKDIAIEIHSPTDLEPYYSVRDFGIGMSREMVETTFMTLGESTKRNSNDLVGAKGIGSKAPFAVTDMFTVISIKDGIKTVYQAYMDEGLPFVAPLHTEETDEHNGVEIKFSIDPKEIYLYRRALVSCLRYAKFPYTVNDPFIASEIEKRTYPLQYVYEENGWMVEIYSSASSYDGSVVVMGQQPYKSAFLQSKTGWPMMTVTIPIGDCDVNPGREWTVEGKGDKGFQERLQNFVETAVEKRGAEITAELEKLPNLKDVIAYMRSIGGFFSTKYGAAFVAKMFEEASGERNIEKCDVYGGTGCKLRKDQLFCYSDFMNGNKLVFDDDGKCIRSKCNYYHDHHGGKVFVSGTKAAFGLLNHPFFKGYVFRLSEMEKKPRLNYSGGRADYIPGHCVMFYDETGELHHDRISRKDFEDIDNAMFFTGGSRKGKCALGWLQHLRNQPQEFFQKLNIKGRLYLVPWSREKWLDDSCRKVYDDEILSLVKDELLPYWLERKANQSTEYKDMRLLLKNVGVKVEVFNHRPAVNVSDYYNVPGYSIASCKAEEIIKRRVKMGAKYRQRIEKRYPLLRYIGLQNYNEPDVVDYRKLIDCRGEF